MCKINQRPVIVIAAAAIVLGALCLSPLLLGKSCPETPGVNPIALADCNLTACEILGGLARNFVVDFLFTQLLVGLGIFGWRAALHFAVRVSIGFQAVLLLCGIAHDTLPMLLFTVRTGTVLVKALLA